MGARFSAHVQTGLGAHPASRTMGNGSFPGVKSDRGVRLIPHPLLVPWPRKSRAIPLLPLWTVRPVHILSACTRVHFTFTFTVNEPTSEKLSVDSCAHVRHLILCTAMETRIKCKALLTLHRIAENPRLLQGRYETIFCIALHRIAVKEWDEYDRNSPIKASLIK